jgi:hypothetical protein
MASTDILDFPAYGVLDEATFGNKTAQLLGKLKRWYIDDGFNWNDLKYSEERLRYIIDMVERRRLYFHVYHAGMEMGELNEACLQCFWILKLYPFFDAKNPERDVNLFFAIEVFTNGITYTAEMRKPKENANFGPRIIEHLEHAFRFRDISKEALMALAESMIFA